MKPKNRAKCEPPRKIQIRRSSFADVHEQEQHAGHVDDIVILSAELSCVCRRTIGCAMQSAVTRFGIGFEDEDETVGAAAWTICEFSCFRLSSRASARIGPARSNQHGEHGAFRKKSADGTQSSSGTQSYPPAPFTDLMRGFSSV
ncbi:hypothetical protein [Bradyrhizobium sp. NC92]|uniref:hypothetical protein n=1 Tax=Bradyrhizobium sp. (strain NC92) TaxID=55395 RepID=UPI0021A9AB7C|nr:hypothetical protein [Bradyrhizobium sp. NC92]UWU67739.1 hypothetical protein N2602_31640 [Bradyrhizobium sp. NC92]